MGRIVHGLLVMGCLGSLSVTLEAQQVLFDDNFSEDPVADRSWVFNGVATWVPPPGVTLECADPNVFDPMAPCSVYSEDDVKGFGLTTDQFGGYILITDAVNSRAGNAFRAEPDEYDNFKLEVVVEIRDGSISRPADGMAVVIVGGVEAPNRTGSGGGGMGVPCVGVTDSEPIMVFEFDDWSCNAGDNNDANHVAFAYSPAGFPCQDTVPPDVFVPIDPAVAKLHNQQPPKAPPNRYRMTVFVQDDTVACNLEAIDLGVNLGRLYTYQIPNFEAFEGYLGVTASTGGARQNHILHSARMTALPPGFCLIPPGVVSRALLSTCGEFRDGEAIGVELTITEVRQPGQTCAAPTSIVVKETLPEAWSASDVSDGGSFDQASRTITWMVPAAAGKTMTYTALARDTGAAEAVFQGRAQEGSAPIFADSASITVGETAISVASGPCPQPFGRRDGVRIIDATFDREPADECPGGFTCNSSAAAAFTPAVIAEPGHEGRLRLTSERNDLAASVIFNDEIDLRENSLTAEFDLFLSKASAGDPGDGLTLCFLDAMAHDPSALGQMRRGLGYGGLGGFAVEFDTWGNPADPSGYNNQSAPFAHVALVRDGNVDNHVQSHLDLNGRLCPGSWDPVRCDGWPDFVDTLGTGNPLHVEVDYNNGHLQVWLSSPETAGGLEPAFDRTRVLDTLVRFPVAGGGGKDPVLKSTFIGFTASTGDATATHEVDNVVVTIYRATEPGTPFRRGDADVAGGVNVTDGIHTLNYLFLGGPASPCADAADADDDGFIRLTDPIVLLNYLFLAGPAPDEPFAACDTDPTEDSLTCERFPPCSP